MKSLRDQKKKKSKYVNLASSETRLIIYPWVIDISVCPTNKLPKLPKQVFFLKFCGLGTNDP